jgi:hypothetical protein
MTAVLLLGGRILSVPLVVAAMALCGPAAARPSLDYAVKAAYLPKFVPFIAWPDGAFASPTAPVTLCVMGGDPFDGRLEQAAHHTRVGERLIAVRHLGGSDAQTSCHLLFLPADADPGAAAATLEAVRGRPVVTVTDSGMKLHGVISFVVEANHVRFDIDDGAAAQGGLTISSKLLSLARVVKQRGQP